MNINRAIVVGNITRDPEQKALPSGMQVTNFTVATNRQYKDNDGHQQSQAEFHNITTFGKTAENCAQYLTKGQEVAVEGRLQTQSWEDKNGGPKRYKTVIIAENVQFGSRKGGNDEQNSGDDRALKTGYMSKKDDAPAEQKQTTAPPAPNQKVEYPKEDINPDDIPF